MSWARDDRHPTGRRTLPRALMVVAAVPPALLALSLLGFFPGSEINCWQDDIDITSGRIRHTRYRFWVPVTRSVRDSALTKTLSPEDSAGRRADWPPD